MTKQCEVIKGYLMTLFDEGVCSREDISKLLGHFSSGKLEAGKLHDLQDSLTMFHAYDLGDRKDIWKAMKEEGIQSVWTADDSKKWTLKMRDAARRSYAMEKSVERTPPELLKEFQELNRSNASVLPPKLESLLLSITEASKKISQLLTDNPKPVEKWESKDLKDWGAKARRNSLLNQESYVPELFAVLQRAMFCFKGYCIRDVGVLSIYILLSDRKQGCLAKIATGEGKSGLVATLAAIKILQGHTVDIVTSSPILARRDAVEEWPGFYEMLGLTVGENSGDKEKFGVPKSCYRKDVVYGDSSTFEGDILREEFSRIPTRGDRPFDVVIVDEVDSMFIDGSNHSTRLIDRMPQMDSLEELFAAIWSMVTTLTSSVFDLEDAMLIVQDSALGHSGELCKALCSALDPNLKRSLNVEDFNTLQVVVDEFAAMMLKEELQNDAVRRQVANLLCNQKLFSLLPTALQSKMSKPETKETKVDKGSSLVDDFIRAKWDVSSLACLRKILEVFLDVAVTVFEVNDHTQDIDHCPLYHTEFTSLLWPEPEVDDSVPKYRFLMAEQELYFLHQVENGDLAAHIEKVAQDKISGLVKPSSENEQEVTATIKVPGHLYSLFHKKIDDWIRSAIKAKLSLEQDRDYILKPSDVGDFHIITPVDFENTGVIQDRCVWGEGLHQFLQLKHKLRVTPEYLPTNFLSNLSYFRRYGKDNKSGRNCIYGMTGTLGGKDEAELLQEMYDVTTFNVPTFKPKRLLELRPFVAQDGEQWMSAVLQSTSVECDNGRVVLIISKTIDDVHDLHNYLREKLSKVNFRLYDRSDVADSEAAISSEMTSRTVIIATNLAGRGTNIKLSKEVVANGGLHVIVSFLPMNVRVEEQAAGRAARCGEPGTWQLILNGPSDAPVYLEQSHLRDIRRNRDESESSRVHHIRTELLAQLEHEEDLFKKFCDLKKDIEQKSDPKSKTINYIIKGVAERWAVQLEETKTGSGVLDWSKFFKDLRKEYDGNEAVRNPSYYILQGNESMTSADRSYSKAIEYYDKAIGMDKVFVEQAHYNKAYAIINEGKGDYKMAAKDELDKASELIQMYAMASLANMHAMVDSRPLTDKGTGNSGSDVPGLKSKEGDSEFTKQVISKINFYYLQLRSIQEALEKMDSIQGNVIAKFSEVSQYVEQNKQKSKDPIEVQLQDFDVGEVCDNGFVSFLYVEKKPAPWYTSFTVILMGLVQVAAGAVMMVLTSAQVGMGFIFDGVRDVVDGVLVAMNKKDLSLKDYFKSKAIEAGLSLLGKVGAGVFKAVKSLSIVKKFTGGVKSIFRPVAKVARKVFSKGKKMTSNVMSKISKSMGSSSNHRFSKAIKAIREKAINFRKSCKDFGRKVWDNATDALNLSQAASENLKNIGQAFVRQLAVTGLTIAEDKLVLGNVSNVIEKKLKSSIADVMRQSMNPPAALGMDLTAVLESQNGTVYQTKLAVEVAEIIDEEPSLDKKLFQNMSTKLVDLLSNKLKDKMNVRSKKGPMANLLMDSVVDVISSTTVVAIITKEVERPVQELLQEVDAIVQNMKTEMNIPVQGATPINANDVSAVINEYVETWSAAMANKMATVVVNKVIEPLTSQSLSTAYSTITRSDEFQKHCKETTKSNRAIWTDRVFHTDVKSSTAATPSGDANARMQLTICSTLLQKPIEVYSVSEDGDSLDYRECFGDRTGKGTSMSTIKILQHGPDFSSATFSPIVQLEDGSMEIMELDTPDGKKDRNTLSSAVAFTTVTNGWTPQKLDRFQETVNQKVLESMPRLLCSFPKVKLTKMDAKSRDIICCTPSKTKTSILVETH